MDTPGASAIGRMLSRGGTAVLGSLRSYRIVLARSLLCHAANINGRLAIGSSPN